MGPKKEMDIKYTQEKIKKVPSLVRLVAFATAGRSLEAIPFRRG